MSQAAALPAPNAAPAKHIVDVLIEERAPKLSASPLWPLLRPPLMHALNYGKAVRMADTIAPMGGREAMESISDLLRVKLQMRGFERVPREGAFLLLANHHRHPTASPFMTHQARRPDILFYAPMRSAFARAFTAPSVEWVQPNAAASMRPPK